MPLLVCFWVEHPWGFDFEQRSPQEAQLIVGTTVEVIHRLWEKQRRLEDYQNEPQGHGWKGSQGHGSHLWSFHQLNACPNILFLPSGFPGNWPIRIGKKIYCPWKLPKQICMQSEGRIQSKKKIPQIVKRKGKCQIGSFYLTKTIQIYILSHSWIFYGI